MTSRRDFLFGSAAAAVGASVVSGSGRAADSTTTVPIAKTGSDIGSLYPFVQKQADRSTFSLSFVHNQFKTVAAWKEVARGKLLELLHYAPAPCAPAASWHPTKAPTRTGRARSSRRTWASTARRRPPRRPRCTSSTRTPCPPDDRVTRWYPCLRCPPALSRGPGDRSGHATGFIRRPRAVGPADAAT